MFREQYATAPRPYTRPIYVDLTTIDEGKEAYSYIFLIMMNVDFSEEDSGRGTGSEGGGGSNGREERGIGGRLWGGALGGARGGGAKENNPVAEGTLEGT